METLTDWYFSRPVGYLPPVLNDHEQTVRARLEEAVSRLRDWRSRPTYAPAAGPPRTIAERAWLRQRGVHTFEQARELGYAYNRRVNVHMSTLVARLGDALRVASAQLPADALVSGLKLKDLERALSREFQLIGLHKGPDVVWTTPEVSPGFGWERDLVDWLSAQNFIPSAVGLALEEYRVRGADHGTAELATVCFAAPFIARDAAFRPEWRAPLLQASGDDYRSRCRAVNPRSGAAGATTGLLAGLPLAEEEQLRLERLLARTDLGRIHARAGRDTLAWTHEHLSSSNPQQSEAALWRMAVNKLVEDDRKR